MATVYSKKDALALRADKSPEAAQTASLKFGEKAEVVQKDGRWLRVRGTKGQAGWVYEGNVSAEPPPEINRTEMRTTGAGEATMSTASHGLSETAVQYAERKGEGEAAALVQWLETRSDAVAEPQVTAYMKERKLGEYAAGGAR